MYLAQFATCNYKHPCMAIFINVIGCYKMTSSCRKLRVYFGDEFFKIILYY